VSCVPGDGAGCEGMRVKHDGQPESESAKAAQVAVPVFSIVTPSFNQGLFLSDALSSVRHQGRPSHEHLVIDGGSSDGTRDVLKSAPGVVRYVIEPDQGQSDALNKGLKMARGRFIGWLNADDFYLPGALQAVERCFASNPDAQVVYGDAVIVDESGRVVRGLEEHGFDASILLYYGCYIPSTATFFRSELVEAGLLSLDTALHYAMDLELFLRLTASGVRFAYLPRDLAAFRWHESAKSTRTSRTARAEALRVQRHYGACATGESTFRAMHHALRLKHALRKLGSGAYVRQLRWRLARGTSLRW
jgi:glycosyltransferase involved in cell wall biosynthesis